MKKGFTLIELLIVVAIIGILAAIAIPNFLNAQVRAKVAAAKAEMQEQTTGLESYVIDHNKYPPMTDPIYGVFHARMSSCLTTPISYIASLPYDWFLKASGAPGTPEAIYWRYTYFNFDDFDNSDGAEEPYVSPWGFDAGTRLRIAGKWLVYNWGPDKDMNSGADHGVYTSYDPTNGTISVGNIIRTQNDPNKYNHEG